MLDNYPKRGEVYWVQCDPALGEEIRKIRPAIVISNDKSNRVLKRFQVMPLTSNLSKFYPSEAIVDVGDQKSKAMANQIFTASILRFGKCIGKVSNENMAAVDDAIRLQLGLDEK